MKVHMKVRKRLQVRVHEGWDPSSFYRGKASQVVLVEREEARQFVETAVEEGGQ